MHRRATTRTLAALLFLSACSSAPPGTPASACAPAPAAPSPPFAGQRPSMQQAAARFAALGVQPGQPLPPLSLVGLDGQAVDLEAFRNGRPMVLVTCSLTCNIARRQQVPLAELRRRWGDAVAFVTVYTIEAHPKTDPSPYTGDEWVPLGNERDGVLVRQPAQLPDRLALANRYASDWAGGVPVLVDTMDDASWKALGEAPNVGLAVDARGVVVARTGWFDPQAIAAALEKIAPR